MKPMDIDTTQCNAHPTHFQAPQNTTKNQNHTRLPLVKQNLVTLDLILFGPVVPTHTDRWSLPEHG